VSGINSASQGVDANIIHSAQGQWQPSASEAAAYYKTAFKRSVESSFLPGSTYVDKKYKIKSKIQSNVNKQVQPSNNSSAPSTEINFKNKQQNINVQVYSGEKS
jgi:flagellar basal body P-ring protein FlgI